MDQPEPPAPAPEGDTVKYDNEEDEGEQFDFDSGDEIPEADRQAAGADATSGSGGAVGTGADTDAPAEPTAREVPTRVSPYSVIDIAPFQEEQCPPAEPGPEDDGVSLPVPSGYSVPVPCGYAVPCNLPLLLPAYSSPVVARAASLHGEETQEVTEDGQFNSLSSEDPMNSDDRVHKEDSALARWVADPANTAWMENPEEAIYDDVPRENSDSEPDEMIYDDVENGEEGGNSSLEYGWSSSEFESYEEQSDSECKNGVPRSFLRSSHKKQLSHDLTRFKEHYEKKMRALMANTVGASEMQQLKHRHELKMQKLMKAAKEGTKDGLEKTKAAVKRGRSLIRTRSFMAPDHRPCLEEEQNLFIDVDCKHPEAVLTPMPEGLSQQQVVRRYILGSVVDSEKNYVDALKRILEQYEKPLLEMEPKILSERKLKVVFYRIKELLQCHGMFQIALASRVADWDSVETIGDVFVASFSKSMVLDAYSEYVNNFSTAVAILKKTCATKPAFLEFLKQCQESSPDRVTLYSLMMKPIQRFPQFILLLQDMLKNTSKGHPDRLPLQMALTELETLAEKLNERKRDADQRCEIKHVAKAINERYLNKLLSSGNRYLVRSDDMIETVYNDRGEIIKTKERRIFMLSDVLMCATVSTRTSDSNTLMSASQRYLLKWSVPLGHVEVVEYGNNDGAGENRCPPVHPPESLAVVANAKPNQVYVGPGQLYQDLQNLLHDLNIVGQISQLIGNLRGNYQNLNQSVAHDWTSGLQRLILKKEEDIRAADCCRIQLQLPGKQDKSGRPTFFTAVFNTFTPAIKESWINNLQMAKLALEEENHMGWFCVEDDGNQIKKERHPLLVGHMPVTVAKQQEFKIECAAYNPEPCLNNEAQPDSLSTAHGFLWIGSCTSQMGQIAIVSFQNSNPKVIECFNVESRILCMVFIPAEERPAEPETAAGRAPGVPTICLGTEEGSISVYKSSQDSKKVRLQHFFTPDRSTVLSLACTPHSLYAGLVNGAVAVYAKAEEPARGPPGRRHGGLPHGHCRCGDLDRLHLRVHASPLSHGDTQASAGHQHSHPRSPYAARAPAPVRDQPARLPRLADGRHQPGHRGGLARPASAGHPQGDWKRHGLLPRAQRARQVPGHGHHRRQDGQGQARGQPAPRRGAPGRRTEGGAAWRGARPEPKWRRRRLAGGLSGLRDSPKRFLLVLWVPDPLAGLGLPGAQIGGEYGLRPSAAPQRPAEQRAAGQEGESQLGAGGVWGPGPPAGEQEGPAAAPRGAGLLRHGLADPPAERVSRGGGGQGRLSAASGDLAGCRLSTLVEDE
ncbi:rho guanine nucleotide exchange factor 10 isoform X3 [Halichoerus grypus]